MSLDLLLTAFGIGMIILAVFVVGVVGFELLTGRYRNYQKFKQEVEEFEKIVEQKLDKGSTNE